MHPEALDVQLQSLGDRVAQQLQATSLRRGDPDRSSTALSVALELRGEAKPIDLVVHAQLWDLARADLAQHRVDLLDMLIAAGVTRINHMQQQVRAARL